MAHEETIRQRRADLWGTIKYHGFSLKDVVIEAGEKYHSTRTDLRTGKISADRLGRLEAAALRLRDKKKQTAS